MSAEPNKRLFFICSPEKKLTAIETFLKKRNYTVFMESDLKIALLNIIETQPDFVFFALDHQNPKINSVPQIIDQSILTNLIPFVHSSSKEEIRKLNYGGFLHKLFPPISGPAIERLVLKIEKEKTAEAMQDAAVRKSQAEESQSDIIKIKKMAVDDYESTVISADDDSQQNTQKQKSSIIMQKGARAELLKNKNAFLSKAKKSSLSEQKKKEIKFDFDSQIKSEITDMILTYQPEDTSHNQSEESSSPLEEMSGQYEQRSASDKERRQQDENSATDKTGGQNNLGSIESKTSSLSDETLANEQSSLRSKMNSNSDHESSSQTEHVIAKCLLIQSEKWCGYLMAYCNIDMDLSALEPILKGWVNQRFENLLDADESDYFDLKINPKVYTAWAASRSEFSDSVKVNQTEIFMSFFGIDPSELIISFDAENELIEIQIDLIPIDADLEFSLHLHLPENKKFLLYTPTNQKLSPVQKKRLQDKNVDKLFTPAVFEKQYKQLIIEHELKNLIELIQTESL